MKRDRKNKWSMIEDAPQKALFFFALPMILGNLFQQFYNMADSVIVGRFVGEDALAAVGASYALTTVFVMLAIGGGTGSSVVTSQYLGAGRYREMKTSVSTALLSFLGLSILLALFGLGCCGLILHALKTPENILAAATAYLKIYFCGLPFLFMYNILAAMFNAIGDSGTPLCLLIFSSLLNVALDILFVTRFGMGVTGVAVATVLAQGISAVISFGLLLGRLKEYEETPQMPEAGMVPEAAQRTEESDGKAQKEGRRLFDSAMLGRMIKVAIPTILQQSIVTAGTRIESICIVPMIATGNAVATFTAQNIGAGKAERIRQGYRAARCIVYGFAVLICVVLVLFKNQIIGVFMEDANALAHSTGVAYLSFIAFFFVCIGLKATTDGVLRGSGDVVVFTAANLVNLAIRVTVANLCAPFWGVAAVWYAVPMGWTTNYLISLVRYLSGKWKEKKLIR